MYNTISRWDPTNDKCARVKWVVTGAAGFIGTNLSKHLQENDIEVCLIDDLSRPGVKENAQYLIKNFGVKIEPVDVSDFQHLEETLSKFGSFQVLVHLAGQVSLLNSINNPRRDFEVNALGTLNVLEFVRLRMPDAVVIGMSSNKIYGDLDSINILELEKKYVAPEYPNGFSETLPIDFHGPYGCSKGAADQYLADYARIYGLKTVSLRQSSVYGPFQKPSSDQGWVTHLMQEALQERKINLYGQGKQVRDLLHVDDLVKLFVELSRMSSDKFGAQFNVGGGPSNSLSILELFEWIENAASVKVRFHTGDFRQSDQKIFMSDNTKISSQTNWRPMISKEVGLRQLAGLA